MDTDAANTTAAAAIARLLDAAHDFAFSLDGRRMDVRVRPSTLPEGPRRSVPMEVSWEGGRCDLWLQAGAYRRKNEAFTRTGVLVSSTGKRDVLWVDLANLLLKPTGPRRLKAWMLVRGTSLPKDRMLRRVQELAKSASLQWQGGDADAGELTDDGAWLPSASECFERLVRVAVLKLPFLALRATTPGTRVRPPS